MVTIGTIASAEAGVVVVVVGGGWVVVRGACMLVLSPALARGLAGLLERGADVAVQCQCVQLQRRARAEPGMQRPPGRTMSTRRRFEEVIDQLVPLDCGKVRSAVHARLPRLADRHAFDVATEDAAHGELVAAGARFIVRAELSAQPGGVVGRIHLLRRRLTP
jgi:hypothetical protein